MNSQTEYMVVKHKSNTITGFSGTLFKNVKTGELILSFRSTEFVDDSLRDSKATCDLEIAKLGWALGQISDMEDFYAELKATGKISSTDFFYVTGYSLGGHLATAFNLLRQEAGEAERIVHTYTFNGAGTGSLLGGAQLQGILSDFRKWRNDPSSIPWSTFSPTHRQYIEREAASRVKAIFDEQARLESLKVPFNPPVKQLFDLVSAKELNYQDCVVGSDVPADDTIVWNAAASERESRSHVARLRKQPHSEHDRDRRQRVRQPWPFVHCEQRNSPRRTANRLYRGPAFL